MESSCGGRAGATERRALGDALMSAFHAFGATLHAAAATLGLTVSQAMVLDQLEAGEPLPMSAIARLLGCDTSNATGLIDRLEQHGLVERQPHPTDRRVRAVALTPTGRRAKDELTRLTRTDNPLLAGMDALDCRTLTAKLQALALATKE